MVAFMVQAVCLSLSFCFAFFSFRAVDDALRWQLATLAASSLVAGIIALTLLVAHFGIKAA